MPLMVSRIARLVFSSCLTSPEAAQRLHLQVVERIDVGRAVAEAARQRRVGFQQLALTGDRQQIALPSAASPPECGRRCCSRNSCVRHQFGVARGDVDVGSWPAACPCWTAAPGRTASRGTSPAAVPAPRSPRRCTSCSTAVPNPYQPGSMMRASDQLNTQGIARRSSMRSDLLARSRPAAHVQIRDLGDRRRGAEECDEAGRLVHQIAVRC